MYVEKANKYILDVLNDKIDVCEDVYYACLRQQNDLKKAKLKDFNFKFDLKKANKICKFIEKLEHVKGAKQHESIKLEPWQCFIYTTVHGWVNKQTDFRRFRIAYIEVPRGNGKSLMLSGEGTYMLCADGEAGADVYSFATTKDQARIVFDDSRQMVKSNADLREYYGVNVLQHAIVVPGTNSKFKAMSADADTLDGLNIHCGIIDELHAHKTRKVFDVVKTGIGKRKQPLLFTITTAGFFLDGVCYQQRKYVQKILRGEVIDDSYFGIIYTIDDGDDWRTEAAAKKANPNWGVSVEPTTVLSELSQALQDPSEENNYKTKHLDVWCNADSAWMQMNKYRKAIRPDVTIDEFEGMPCIYGIDLATKIDIAAVVRLFWRKENDGLVHYYLFPEFFLPSDRVNTSRNSQYQGWANQGLITVTDGPITDLAYIRDYIIEDSKKYNVIAMAYDPWQATQMAQELLQEGAPMVEISPTVLNFSEPMKTIQALIYANRLHTDGNPVLEWMFSNVVCHMDIKENIYPRKETPENKIDGIVSSIMTMNQAIKKEVETYYLDQSASIDWSQFDFEI